MLYEVITQTVIYEAVSGEGERVILKTVTDNADIHSANKLYREFAICQLFDNEFT